VTVRHGVQVALSSGGLAPDLLKPELRLDTLKPVYVDCRNEGLTGVEIARRLGIGLDSSTAARRGP